MWNGLKNARKPNTYVSVVVKLVIIKAIHPPNILKVMEKMMSTGKNKIAAMIFGNTKWFKEFTPIISKASICSVTRMVPISEATFEPTFPARIKEIIVGENSKIVLDCVIYPTVYLGKSGLDMLEAVCKAITPPIKVDINPTIGRELIPILSSSFTKRVKNIFHFLGFVKTMVNINVYFPIFCKYFTKLS